MALTDKLTAIANAIRAKNGTQNTYTVAQMAQAILDIPSGGDPNANFDAYVKRTLTQLSTTATSIPNYLFYNNSAITSISMPNVTSIENNAFQNCTNLALTSLPSGLTSIENFAFYGCKNLALTSLPSGLTSIGNNAFYGCKNLALTSLPSGLTSIENNAFQNCKNLALTSLPSGLTSIGNNAFQNCTNLALTSLPSGLTSIGNNAFYNCTNIPYIDLRGLSSIPTLKSNAFGSTTFPFYFRDQTQLDQFASATNWSALSSRFQIKPS